MSNESQSMLKEQKENTEVNSGISENQCNIVKRSGMFVPFQRGRITKALESAFRDTKNIPTDKELPDQLKDIISNITVSVASSVLQKITTGKTITVEGIQDEVENKLIKSGWHDVAKDYIVYRNNRKILREDPIKDLRVSRRNKSIVKFNPMKITAALNKAFHATYSFEEFEEKSFMNVINDLSHKIVGWSLAQNVSPLDLELIQDQVEKQLMIEGHYDVAKNYILYRQQRSELRENKVLNEENTDKQNGYLVVKKNGEKFQITKEMVYAKLKKICFSFSKENVSVSELAEASFMNFYEGIKEEEIQLAYIMVARAKIEKEPEYAFVTAALLLDILYAEVFDQEMYRQDPDFEMIYRKRFPLYVQEAIELESLNPKLAEFDLNWLADNMRLDRDSAFTYMGLQVLYDRYFIHRNGKRMETPQFFWMRVAMGLAINEGENRNKYALEFYNVLTSFLFTSATPTLFNSGTNHSQLSSCYLSVITDDLAHIFKIMADNAQLSKWAGGLGNDWTNVRATGAMIKGTNGKSQGIVPFIKVANDIGIAVNQGGKRKGAVCAYLEIWHYDIEEFLELRKNTGDDRRRTHDLNTANWIPDLFFKRLLQKSHWTLFSPDEVPGLHDAYGKKFEELYEKYEKKAEKGEILVTKKIDAEVLWRKMVGMIYETGHPWLTFKDPANVRNTQDHAGVIHSGNLCTEVMLNTSEEETAVCNLGSINLLEHIKDKKLDAELVASTVRTAIRMLDNVVDVNYYPIPEAYKANTTHRAVGIGIMGFQDALYKMEISYASQSAVEFADESTELIAYHAVLSSSILAKERGVYPSYKGSKWDRGLLPIDTVELLKKERGEELCDVDTSCKLDWTPVREHIKAYGMRNSNTLAIAPTATISNIIGITQSIEPFYKNLFVKSNLSGEFTIPNFYLIEKCKELGIWDDEMLDDLKYFDGSLLEIERVPDKLKNIFLTAFEIEPEWIIECGSRRQKWVDMSQSLNLYVAEPNGKKLSEMYLLAWRKCLKATYYLRSLGATSVEKSSTDINKRGIQPRWMKNKSASGNIVVNRLSSCSFGEECEACQ